MKIESTKSEVKNVQTGKHFEARPNQHLKSRFNQCNDNQQHQKCIIRTSMGESMVEDDSGEEESNDEELILPLDNNATL